MPYRRYTLFLLSASLLLTSACLRGQTVYLSEASSANTAFYDEDGSLADYLELHNQGSSTIDLGGYSLTDDADTPQRWTFAPGTTLSAGGYLRVWASGKDRPTVTYPHALLG